MSITAMKQALEALEWEDCNDDNGLELAQRKAITSLRQAIEQAKKPKYRRGDRLVCLETEEFCVIHISGTDRQWVKFPDTQVCVFTNQQVDELFELLPKEIEQAELVQRAEKAFDRSEQYVMQNAQGELERISLVQTGVGIGTQAQRQWVSLTDDEIEDLMAYWSNDARSAYGGAYAANGEYVDIPDIIRDAEARLKEKNT